uniref:Uncharacterized protein LOC108046106 n=1 Tax=Drosophila rhopaloa TaxID=1041015 RepID=A0A6P4F718_DRORH
MSKLGAILVLALCLFVSAALAEPRLQGRGQVRGRGQLQGQRSQHPYLFLTIPKGRANAGAVVQGFEIVEEEDDQDQDQVDQQDEDQQDDVNNDDDDDEELEQQLGLNFARSGLAYRKSQEDEEQDDDQDDAQPAQLAKNQMMVQRDQAGAIMVPDGIIEIEGQSVLDGKTGKAALLVPRAALDAIPDGAVVALMERHAPSDPADDDAVEEERANRVVVRRRKNNGRRNIRRRGISGSNNNSRRRRRPAQRRRRTGGNRRRNVRVIQPQNGGQRRRGNQRRRGQVVLQG